MDWKQMIVSSVVTVAAAVVLCFIIVECSNCQQMRHQEQAATIKQAIAENPDSGVIVIGVDWGG